MAGGSAAKVIPSTAGHIIAPPIPMSARVAISQSTLCEAPPSTEKPAKIAEPTKKIRRRPKRSASRPPVTMRTPKTSA